MNHTAKTLNVHIRWMIRRDMPEVLEIESDVFDYPWSEEDFIRVLRQRNCIGMVAEHDERVAGFMLYELYRTRLHVLSFAVARQLWRRGVGSQMVNKIVGKLAAGRRERLILEVRETNLDAQLFFSRCGFRCVNTIRELYDDTNEDAYVFQYRLKRCEGK